VDAFGEPAARAPLAGELESIRAELEARYVDAERGGEALVVTLPRRLFEQAELRPLAKTMLDRVAEVLSRHAELRIAIVGYTDDMGSDAYNREISQRRAEAVASYLALHGLARSTMSVRGAGNSEPRVPNTTGAGRRINRRVELRVETAGA
jgi:outer membrane protein OmpA-like peptidoglycan-associated protein